MLNQVEPDGFDWQVPGLREELVTALIRSLPKAMRRNFVPAPDWAASALERIGPADGPLLDALARELERAGPVEVPPGALDLAKVPDHLRMTFRVVDGGGRRAAARPGWSARARTSTQLKQRLAPRMRAASPPPRPAWSATG